MTHPAPDDGRTLIDRLLDEQRTLTAVERFSRLHETNGAPAREKFYRDLIPLNAPQPGQQYAFEVDLDKCTGCKACVTACHSLNGLDETETWRSVGLLITDKTEIRKPKPEGRNPTFEFWRSFGFRDLDSGFQQHITTACHHCVEPGCLEGCPVLAYDKDPLTGIVRHLDDQCIGCQYCVMKCPYDVPKYSKKRGIVRKCDMCANRLSAGEAPACVQACPSEAIRIGIVNRDSVKDAYRGNADHAAFLPASPDPAYTLPTTRYTTSRPMPERLLAGDHANVAPADAHPPLVFMLVFTQLSVGAGAAGVLAGGSKWLSAMSFAAGAMALAVASLHLGKPMKAWRAFLGWRKSWFSREVIAFGVYMSLSALSAAAFWVPSLAPLQRMAALAAVATGLAGVACSAMIYVDTRREFWNAPRCFGKFLGTTALLGLASALAAGFTSGHRATWLFAGALAVVSAMKIGLEHRIFRHRADVDSVTLTSLNKTARLLTDQLGLPARLRIACGIFGGVILPLMLIANAADARVAWLALAMCVLGELIERYLFFTAVSPVKMPGGIEV